MHDTKASVFEPNSVRDIRGTASLFLDFILHSQSEPSLVASVHVLEIILTAN